MYTRSNILCIKLIVVVNSWFINTPFVCNVVLSLLSRFAITLMLIVFLLSYDCLCSIVLPGGTVCWSGMRSVIVAFSAYNS